MANMRNDYEMRNEIWNDDLRCETWINSSIDQRYESLNCMRWCIQMLNEILGMFNLVLNRLNDW